MHIYNVSNARRTRLQAQINWSRELTFSYRQTDFIRQNVANVRGVYCIYAKNYLFAYQQPQSTIQYWSSLLYIGSGWISDRLTHHLRYGKNDVLANYLTNYNLAFRCERVFDEDDAIDYPRAVEAGLLQIFKQKFDALPPANRREEGLPEMQCDEFILNESPNFSVFARGR
jgi:hypothetical protein